MEETIDQRSRAEVIAEVVAPRLPRDVARDDRRETFVVSGEQDLLHEPRPAGCVAFDLLKTDFVDDEELRARVRLERLYERVVGEAHVEPREHVGARGVEHAAIRGAGDEAQGERDVALAGSRHAREQDVLALRDEAKGRELHHEVLVERGLEGEVEGLEGLADRQARVENRAERRIHDARLPVRKTFEAFNFAFQPTLDKDLVMELATLRFVAQGKNVLLAGMSGTGKSHIALTLGLVACAANRRVLYTTSADMLARLNMSLADDTLAKALKPYTRAELLVIDEVGLEQVERDAARRSGLMQKVLLPRHNEHRSTIITSNIPWESWGDYLGDHLGATALIDRLLHRSHVIVINGPSYRDWAHKQDVASAKTGAKSMPETATPDPKPRGRATSAGARRRGK